MLSNEAVEYVGKNLRMIAEFQTSFNSWDV